MALARVVSGDEIVQRVDEEIQRRNLMKRTTIEHGNTVEVPVDFDKIELIIDVENARRFSDGEGELIEVQLRIRGRDSSDSADLISDAVLITAVG